MFKKQIPFFIAFCLLVFSAFSTYADTSTIVLGGKDGWKNLQNVDSIAFSTGRFGYQSVEVSTDMNRVTPNTDLLISFENDEIRDSSRNYTVTQQDMFFSNQAVMGKSAGMNRGSGTGFSIHGEEGTLFGTSGLTGSFVIEFWLCPSLSESGEIIFNWRSSRTISDRPVFQVIRASFFNNRIEWVFDNIFGSGDTVIPEVLLTSISSVIPKQWAHHSISYDDDIGLLEYRIDGQIEAIRYVTSDNHESGEVRNATLGVPADISICSKYNGLIDDFTIRREPYIERRQQLYATRGGRFESEPLDTNGYNSLLTELNAITTTPQETDIAFYVRGGDNYHSWTPEEPEWIPVLPGEKIEGVLGRYFQVAVELYPDGNGEKTPSVSEITLSYNETVPPLPPATIIAKPGNGYVDLTWSASVDNSVGGYIIYYGERQGEYLGSIAVQGKSPINVGNVRSYRLTGLTNGRIYYFAVSAYSALDTRITGTLSKEVFARPLRKTR